jgi:hypothetical protein
MANQDSDKEDGLIVVLLERMRTQRLPRLLGIREKVFGGATLDQSDIDFLSQVFEDATKNQAIWERHPETHEIGAQLVHLYREITARALANEGGAAAL